MSQTQWIRVMDAAELDMDKPRTIKTHGKQIVVFRLGEDEVQAIDNRCPHEGYPLSTGMLKDGVLTCEWHNWKFRLCDGACVLGGEDVRHYPLRIADGGIWLDLHDQPRDQAVPGLYSSLKDAFFDGDWGWAGRTMERLLQAGAGPAEILGFVCDWGAMHAPYGFDHGMAAAADLAGLLQDEPDNPGALLLEAANLIVDPNLRRPERALAEAEAVDPDSNWDEVGDELCRRIEAEELAGAEALVRGAVIAGAAPGDLFTWLTRAATDHFLGYGHAHIYCVKAEELLQVIGWEHAHPVLTSLVSHIVYETREDRLPYMREYGRHMEVLGQHLDRLAAASAGPDRDAGRYGGDAEAQQFFQHVVDGDLAAALGAVAEALNRGVSPRRIALALSVCASWRLLRFDPRIELDDEVNEGWLHITHTLTHADAVHESLVRRPGAAVLRGLFHSARFIQHLAVCDLPAEERPVVPEIVPGTDGGQDLTQALAARDAQAAMAAVRAGLSHDASAVAGALISTVLADRATIPIFVAHHIKTTLAGLRLYRALSGDPELAGYAHMPLVAVARFLAHPLQERRIARRALASRLFVHEGRMVTKLIGY